MAFSITINEKHKYSKERSKPIATGNSGGTDADSYVNEISFNGRELTLSQTNQEDLVTEFTLTASDIPTIEISQVNNLQNNLDSFVRHDTDSQGLNPTEQSNARKNIDVYSKPEINSITGDLNILNTPDKDNLVLGINQANNWKEVAW